MSGKHLASFNWGAGPNSVSVAGGFNDWSATASPLVKQADGTFTGQFPLEYGSRHALKYVVDGEWKVREDEAKEWDAAGNCNNVYTSPAAPPAAASTAASTAPSTLLAANAPSAASTGAAPAVTAPSAASTGGATTGAGVVDLAGGKAASVQPVPSLGSHVLPDAREQTAATSNVGAAGATQEHSLLEKAAGAGGAAAAALGAVIGSAVASVEKATGVELSTGNPLTLEEAKAKGINVDALDKKELPTDAVSPAGSKPPAGSADALSEKLATLRTDVPAPAAAVEKKPNDIPAQDETKDNHKSVPAPAIAAVSAKDPSKDRTLPSAAPADAAKPISSSPAASAATAKKEEEKAATLPSATPAPAAAAAPASAPTASTGSTTAAAAGTAAVTAAAAADAAPATDAKSKNTGAEYIDPMDKTVPKTPAKEAHPIAAADSGFPGKLPETPAKSAAANGSAATPASNKTATSTPNKSVKKKKSSFFGKLKQAFSPKDKEKK